MIRWVVGNEELPFLLSGDRMHPWRACMKTPWPPTLNMHPQLAELPWANRHAWLAVGGSWETFSSVLKGSESTRRGGPQLHELMGQMEMQVGKPGCLLILLAVTPCLFNNLPDQSQTQGTRPCHSTETSNC